MEERDTPFDLNDRLIVQQHKATVRYIGPVDGQDGDWIGLEWDDVSRGKHDGSHGGKRYFTCASDQPAGSFVRLPKLLQVADFGRTLAEAAVERYGHQLNKQQTTQEDELLYVSTVAQRKVPVRMIGMEKAPGLQDSATITQATLVGMHISKLGSSEDIVSALGNVTELDLSNNLLGDWNIIRQLLEILPRVQILNLSGNRLTIPPPPQSPVERNGAFDNNTQCTSLRSLILNRTQLKWGDVLSACTYLPSLTELRFCGANLHSLTSNGPAAIKEIERVLGNVQVLDLEDNNIKEWSEIQCLSSLPSLKTLLLSGNAIQRVTYEGAFTQLAHLMLGKNSIDSWSTVDELSKFPALCDVRLSDNPLTVADPNAARYETIARMARLTSLNGSPVSSGERWDAELTYLRQVTNQLDQLKNKDDGDSAQQVYDADILRQNPRFDELVDKYGRLAPAGAATNAGSALSTSMAEITFTYGAKTMKKKIPGKLKLVIDKLFRVKAAQQHLELVYPAAAVSSETTPSTLKSKQQSENITNDDTKELRQFEVADGCIIQVTKLDAAAKADRMKQVDEAAEAVQNLRMERQEKELQLLHAEEQRLMTLSSHGR